MQHGIVSKKLRIFVPLGLSFLSSCNCDVSVPKDANLDGCWGVGGIVIAETRSKKLFYQGEKISDLVYGRDRAGSYILFSPAIHAKKESGNIKLVLYNKLPTNRVATIMEWGNIEILMPEEPIGEYKLKQIPCK